MSRVTVVGLGALGHLVALDLARAGVGHLHLVDYDVVSVDTASRQYPVRLAGEAKPDAAKALIRSYNPWTSVSVAFGGVGGATPPRVLLGKNPTDIVDATADPATTRFLARYAHDQRLPFCTVSATAGGAGGMVLSLPDFDVAGGCFECFERHRADGSLPLPPELAGGWLVPPRCSAATFTGYGHDLALVAHQASRRVIAGITTAVPLTATYDVADLSPAGAPAAWQSRELPPHPACTLAHPGPQGAQLMLDLGAA